MAGIPTPSRADRFRFDRVPTGPARLWLVTAAVFLTLAVADASRSLQAQEASDTTSADSVQLLGGITVRLPRPTLTSGGASTVEVDLDSAAHALDPTLEDVLRSMPLIQIRRNSRGEAQPTLRGSEDRQVAMLMDGVPLTLGWDHRTDMSTIPLTAARRVTLIRGLSSVLYGPNTLGGVVEVDVARAGSPLEAVDPLTLGASLDGAGGTNVSVTGGYLSGVSGRQWAVRGGLGVEDLPGSPLAGELSDDPDLRPQFLSDGDLRLNSDVRRIDAFLVGRYRAEEGAWASLSTSSHDVERGVPPEAHQDAPRLWRYPYQRRLIAALSGGTGQRATPLGEGDLEASVGVDLGSTRIEQFVSEAYQTVEETEQTDDRVITLRLLGEHTLGARGDLRAAATFANVRHHEVLTPGGASEYGQRLWSTGAEAAWRLGSSGGTTVTAGAALDGADTPRTGGRPPLGGLTEYGVRIGVSSLMAPGLLTHAGMSRRARFPSLRELYSDALGRFEPNPDLRAETLLGAEAGLTLRGRMGEVQVVGFAQRLEDGILRTSVVGSDGIPRFKRINQTEVRSSGVELLTVAAMGRATISGDLTLQSVRGIDPSGTEILLEYEPDAYGRMRVEAPLVREVLGSAEARFVGAQWCENPEVGGLDRLPGSGSLYLALRRALTLGTGGALRRWDVSLGVTNVTDEAVFGQCGLPEPGRLFRLQLRVR